MEKQKLSVGDECDYNPFDTVWFASRIEDVSINGWVIRVRFSCGTFDVSHALDLRDEASRRRIAACGAFSVPVLTGMHVDVFRRLTIAGINYEQWQRGWYGL